MMKILEIFPPPNTVQQVSQFFMDLGESGRWQYYSITAIFFFFLVFLAFYSSLQDTSTFHNTSANRSLIKRIFLSDFTFFAITLFFVLMSRIPLAVLGIQNPDEPLWVEAAKTLVYDPRPYVSVDTGTGGPIVPFALLGLKIFGLPIDQGTTKIMTGAIMGLNAGFVFFALSITIGSAFSRLVSLPFIVAISLMRSSELIAYNSEHPVILLISISLFFLASCMLSE